MTKESPQVRSAKMPRFKVGQIVYLLLKEQHAVLPAQIVTENKKKTREGLVVTYDAIVGPENDTKEFVISETNKDIVFDTPRKVQQHLVEEAAGAIKTLVTDAESSAKSWYIEGDDDDDDDDGDDDEEEERLQPKVSTRPGPKVQLEDGSVVNVVIGEPREG